MYSNSTADDQTDGAGEPQQVSALTSTSPPIFAADDSDAKRMRGTVEAFIAPDDRHFYRQASEMIIRGTPVANARKAEEPQRARLGAKELADELQSINTQIHQIMFQVERAVARLATSG